MSVDEVMCELQMDRIFYEESSGGVTFSGGEPLMQHEFLLELLKECKINRPAYNCSIHQVMQIQLMIDRIRPFTDLFLYDLKLIDENDHIRYTGVSNKLILENLVA